MTMIEIQNVNQPGKTYRVEATKFNAIKAVMLKVMPKDGKVLVSGINVHARHTKPTQARPQGGIVRTEAPLHISKVAVEDPKTGKPTRVRFEERDGKKVRVAVRSGELING